ncbi:unnamed protein product [Prorocentrum cordatum]|uniref:Rab-GAP TBC domain-containing protein n=1 Tax=Prorocentrum cordatum TaxID=2364126 RepID=A0ABN9QM80_9DINO|nr:unnamed protein product [Polarella glacialis]
MVVLALVDAHRSLGRAFCEEDALREAIFNEVCDEAAESATRAPAALLGALFGGAQRALGREEIRSRAASVTAQVLSGERPPPGGLPRAVDAVAAALRGAAGGLPRLACLLFGDAGGPGAVAFAKSLPCLQVEGLLTAWNDSERASSIPGAAAILAGHPAVREASVLLLFTARPLPTAALAEQLRGTGGLAPLHCVHCGAAAPQDLHELAGLCSGGGGSAATAPAQEREPGRPAELLRAAVRRALGLEAPAPAADLLGLEPLAPAPAADLLGLEAPQAPAADLLGLEEKPALAWGPGVFLGGREGLTPRSMAVQSDRGDRPEIAVGDVLVCARSTIAFGSKASRGDAVAAALRDPSRPLAALFCRPPRGQRLLPPAPQASVGALDLDGSALAAAAGNMLAAAASMLEQQRLVAGWWPAGPSAGGPAAPADGGGAPEAAADEALAGSVLAQAEAQALEQLDPEQRQARIRELVALQVRLQQGGAAASAALPPGRFVSASISRVLDLERQVDNRLLLEWLLVLSRTMAFCGGAASLGRARCVSRLWGDALKFGGSTVATKLWKWAVRFGDPPPQARRPAFWRWLRARRGRAAARELPADPAAELESLVERARCEEGLADAREAIAEDVSLTLASLGDGVRGPLLHGSLEGAGSPWGLEELQETLERLLLALAVARPAVGYRQGLDAIAAFALSLAEEERADDSEDAEVEAEALRLLLAVTDLCDARPWDGTVGPRAGPPAVAALARLARSRLPRLAAHLGAELERLCGGCLPWLRTLFVGCAPLPRAALSRLWECWLLDGSPKVFFRAALAVLARAEGALLAEHPSRATELLQQCVPPMDPSLVRSRLVPAAWAMKVTSKVLRRTLSEAGEEKPGGDSSAGHAAASSGRERHDEAVVGGVIVGAKLCGSRQLELE